MSLEFLSDPNVWATLALLIGLELALVVELIQMRQAARIRRIRGESLSGPHGS
jgi:hypothetical protein